MSLVREKGKEGGKGLERKERRKREVSHRYLRKTFLFPSLILLSFSFLPLHQGCIFKNDFLKNQDRAAERA